MKWLKICAFVASALLVSSCSVSDVAGLIGKKPDATAQVGEENVKQTIGVTAKREETQKTSATVKESTVGAMEASPKKHVTTSSITASKIDAEKIEIRNDSGSPWFLVLCFFVGWMVGGLVTKRNKAA